MLAYTTLCDLATPHQPKNNVEPTLKCLLGRLPEEMGRKFDGLMRVLDEITYEK